MHLSATICNLLNSIHPRTSPFRLDAQYSRSMVVPLRRPTAGTAQLVQAALAVALPRWRGSCWQSAGLGHAAETQDTGLHHLLGRLAGSHGMKSEDLAMDTHATINSIPLKKVHARRLREMYPRQADLVWMWSRLNCWLQDYWNASRIPQGTSGFVSRTGGSRTWRGPQDTAHNMTHSRRHSTKMAHNMAHNRRHSTKMAHNMAHTMSCVGCSSSNS